jgi:hypothetical protein
MLTIDVYVPSTLDGPSAVEIEEKPEEANGGPWDDMDGRGERK